MPYTVDFKDSKKLYYTYPLRVYCEKEENHPQNNQNNKMVDKMER